METNRKRYLEAGRIVGTHGGRGELRVDPWCDSVGFLQQLNWFYWDEAGQSRAEILSARPHKSLLLVKLRGIETVEQADALRGKILYLDRGEVNLPEGRYFIQDLIGLTVSDADSGAVYGVLTDVIATGANDVYEITSPQGKKHLMPAVEEMVPEISPEKGFIFVRPIRGIFDDAD